MRDLVDALSDAEVAELLAYAHWLREAPETLPADELARVREGATQVRRGEYVTLEALKRDLGLCGTRSG